MILSCLINKEVKELDIKEILNTPNVEMVFLSDDSHTYSVDLRTGLFYLNAIPLNTGYTFLDTKYRLIYYKRMRVEIGPQGKSEQYLHAYLLGWQITYEGKNIQRIMSIDPKTFTVEVKEKR